MRMRPIQRHTGLRGAILGYERVKARVCAQPLAEYRPARPLAADDSFSSSTSGVNHALSRRNKPPLSPFHLAVSRATVLPLFVLRAAALSSALIIRRYTTNSATMALRGTLESNCHGTRAASTYQRHC